MALPARFGKAIDECREGFSGDRSGAVVDQKMIRNEVRLDARDSIELFECGDDGLLRRTAAGAGERQRRTLGGKDFSMV